MNDSGSAGVLAVLVLVLILVGFIYICAGPVIDTMNDHYVAQHTDPLFPVSQDRATCIENLNLIFSAFLIVAVLLPVSLYAIITANAESDGGL